MLNFLLIISITIATDSVVIIRGNTILGFAVSYLKPFAAIADVSALTLSEYNSRYEDGHDDTQQPKDLIVKAFQ